MPMPKASVNEDHLSQARKDEVRTAWEIIPAKAEAESEAMGRAPYPQLGFRVPAADGRHNLRPLVRSEFVSHRSVPLLQGSSKRDTPRPDVPRRVFQGEGSGGRRGPHAPSGKSGLQNGS